MNEVIKRISDIVNAIPEELEFVNWVFGEHKCKVSAGFPVVLYGTGNLGRDFLRVLNSRVGGWKSP